MHAEWFRPSAGGLELAEALAARGQAVDDPGEPHSNSASWWDGSRQVVTFVVKGRAVHMGDGDNGSARLVVAVGPFPATAPVFERLARVRSDEEGRVLLDEPDGVLVELCRSFPPEAADAALAWITAIATFYEGELAQAASTYERGHALPDLASNFAGAGLSVPRLPRALAERLCRRGEWWWSSRLDEPNPLEDYLWWPEPAGSCLRSPVPDHVTVAHAGHGLNSYALTWRLAFGPLAVRVQSAYGGIDSSDAEDVAEQASLFRRVSSLVAAVDEVRFPFSHTPRMRAICVEVSTLRGVRTALRWDGQAGAWTSLLGDGADELSDHAWWEQIERAVRSAEEPR